MKVIMRTGDIARLGNKKTWEFLKSKGMDMDKPITGRPYKASNTAYGFVYEGESINGRRA